ncbi:uncharacterized protein LOC124171238 [Ischnura elegans]|uniref:uncharacterized protein LOC124171238 n=1 Tax=Ischnura elegans TaxID=197161 RepID=UPI001ED8AB40|nr:uncharacterized protein LOC124171238 [Ischnura elegans]
MGSPLSPVMANLFMEDFEAKAIETYQKKPKLWLRYVDDTFVVWPHGAEELDKSLCHLNQQHPRIQFTTEKEEDGKLAFLDVLVKRKGDGRLGHAVYRKPTHTDRYLMATSHHHPAQKASVVSSLFHRAFTIADAESLNAEKKQLASVLQKNGFNMRMVLKRADKVTRAHSRPSEQRQEEELTKFNARLTIPYTAGVSESRILRKHDVVTRYNCVTKIHNLIPGPKDNIPQDLCEGVYKVPCSCGKAYIGETCRGMATRIKEHARATKQKQLHLSAIAEHAWSGAGHSIDFEGTKMVAKDNRYYPRLIREALEIHKNNKDRRMSLKTLFSNSFEITLSFNWPLRQ